MRTYLVIVLLLTVGCLALVARAAGTDPRTTAAQGDYRIARLELQSGGGPAQTLLLACRAGKLATLWFVQPIDGDQRLHVQQSTVQMTPTTIAGQVQLRTATGRDRPMLSGTLTLDLRVNGGEVAGTYELALSHPTVKAGKGIVTGRLDTAQAPGLAPEAKWTSFWGPNSDMSAQPQPTLVDDLAKAKPVWRSEAYIPTGYGNAPDSRYFTRALISGNGGGGSSPVVADGTVYMYFYLPSPDAPPIDKKNPYWVRSFPDDAAFEQRMKALQATPDEVKRVEAHFAAFADDYVVAIDAATGATRWTTVLPHRSPNLQTHKHRGISGVPLVVGDMLYVPNLGSRLYAISTVDGQVKWETPAFDSEKLITNAGGGPSNPSPLFLGGRIIWAGGGTVFALDPQTGAVQWKAPGGYYLPWRVDNTEYLLTFAGTGSTLTCLDAATGQKLWAQETDMMPRAPLSAVIAGDLLVGATKEACPVAWKLSVQGAKSAWKAEAITPDENLPITIARDKVILLGAQDIRVLDLATGKTVAERKTFTPEYPGPGSNAWVSVVGDRWLFSPEGQHGTQHLVFVDGTSADCASQGTTWLPTNTSTTAYNSQPIVFPIVDGRLFLRGGDGIYCYDLRK